METSKGNRANIISAAIFLFFSLLTLPWALWQFAAYFDFGPGYFKPQTLESLFALSLAIILVASDTLLLCIFLREKGFLANLSISLAVNAALLVTAYYYLTVNISDNIFNMETQFQAIIVGMIISVKALLFRVLYSKHGLGWLRSVAAAVGGFVVSALAVAALITSVSTGIFYGAYYRLGNWHDKSVLKGESGYIYVSEWDKNGKTVKLKRLDVNSNQWETVGDGGESVASGYWDVVGDMLVVRVHSFEEDAEPQHLAIYHLPDFKPVMKLYGDYAFPELSPDQTKLAVLVDRVEIKGLEGSGKYYPRKQARLKVIDIATGDTVVEAPKPALPNWLCWTKDTGGVVFVSYDGDKPSGNLTDAESADFDGADAGKPVLQQLYLFDIKSGKASRLAAGVRPILALDTGEIMFRRRRDLFKYNLQTGTETKLAAHFLPSDCTVSPSGRTLLAVHSQPFTMDGPSIFTAVSLEDPGRRYILDKDLLSSYSWTK